MTMRVRPPGVRMLAALLLCLAETATFAAPGKLEPGRTERLEAKQHNRAVELTVASVSLLDKFGDQPAPDGEWLLAIDTTWRNTQSAQRVDDQEVPVQYVVPKLADHLYCVLDGRRVLPRAEVQGEGLLAFEQLSLEKQNDTVSGKAVYELPAGAAVNSLELRYYDYAHGHMVVPLVGSPAAAEKPAVPPRKNEVVEAAVFGIKYEASWAGRAAPPGMRFVVIDLRGRSLFETDGDAAAFIPNAMPGEKVKVGTVADWKESRKYIQLVADGEYAYRPDEKSELPQEPRFLPDLFTGGRVAFAVPDKTQSLELICEFPNAALPETEAALRPKPLRFAIEGTPPAPPARPSLASAKDEVFDVSVTGQRMAGEFGGIKPDDGQKFLVLDVTVKNLGQQPEFFQPKGQLKYASESGEQLEYSDATVGGSRPATELVRIPPGERRSFQLVYAIPAADTRPRLAYAAVTEGAASVMTLPPIKKGAEKAAGSPAGCPVDASKGITDCIGLASSDSEQSPHGLSCDDEEKKLPVRVAAKQNHQPQGLAGVGLTPEQVNAAIDKGADALWKFLKENDLGENKELGDATEHELCALALVHAGAHKRFPDFNVALRKYLDSIDAGRVAAIGTYRRGILCMLIESYGDPKYLPKMREAARYLMETQGPHGTWDYSPSVPDEVLAAEKAQAARAPLNVTGGAPVGKPPEPMKRLTPLSANGDKDNSVTQYGLLGLNAASRAGIKMPPEAWKRALDETRRRQDEDGGWNYEDGGDSYGSMTAAGVCAIALCRHELGEKQPLDDPAIEKGLGWLDAFFSASSHPRNLGNDWLYYYLYSMERVGRILDTEFIGTHEWYPLGAQFLVGAQQPGGLWKNADGDEQNERLASSFALLFLTRATVSLSPEPRHGGPGTLATSATAPTNRLYLILDASGSMLEEMDGRRKFDIARDAVLGLVNDLPANSEVGLRVYGHRKAAIEEGADEDTELLVPVGPLDKQAIKDKLLPLRPRGKTPMALSLEQAAGELGDVSENKPMTVVLLTDGGEDTVPRRDPVKAAAAAFGEMKGVRFHLVGFDINQSGWGEQLQAMAKAGNGRYWPAARSADLLRSLRAAVLGLPGDFVVLDPAGRPAGRGTFGQSISLPEGQYTFKTTFAGREFAQEIWINTDATTTIDFDGDAAARAAATMPAAAAAAPGAQQPAAPAKAGTRFCTHCGAPLAPGAKFCPKCGTKVPQ